LAEPFVFNQRMPTHGLSTAAQLILLNGPKRRGGEAMKLTVMELVNGGMLQIEHRGDTDTVGWVPDGAPVPENDTLWSFYGAAKILGEEEPATLMEIAHGAKWVKGDPRSSSTMGWVYRLPLKELYNADLMQTERRLMRPDRAGVTAEGAAERTALSERVGDQDAEAFFGFTAIREMWEGVDKFVKTLNASTGTGGTPGDPSNVMI
jgi:hypothetical protein